MKSPEELKTIIDELLQASLIQLETLFDELDLDSGELWQISDMLTAKSVEMAEMAAYVDTRGGFGCGDSGHEKAMKKRSLMRKKIRKAIGYSYP